MSEFVLCPASRQGIKPLIGLYGKSGGGKTRSALILARGIVGPTGKIGLIDTENRRGHIFADVIPGGYSVLDLNAPFSPDRYVSAMDAVEKTCDILVIDSMTHEWDGEGGILEMQEAELTRMAGDDWKKRESCKMAAWIKPKFAHKKMVYRLLRSPLPVICCLRGAEKTHMEKSGGKTTVVTDDFSSPIFDARFVFEMLINGEVFSTAGKGGFLRIEKITHEDLFACLPKPGEQIALKHGEAIARWCASPGGKQAAPEPAKPEEKKQEAKPALAELKSKLWAMTKHIHAGELRTLETWLRDSGIISDGAKLSDFDAAGLAEIVSKTSVRLEEIK